MVVGIPVGTALGIALGTALGLEDGIGLANDIGFKCKKEDCPDWLCASSTEDFVIDRPADTP